MMMSLLIVHTLLENIYVVTNKNVEFLTLNYEN